MWKYTEYNAYNEISLHDCRASAITLHGSDVVFDFPDGFWLTPISNYNHSSEPVKTGQSQLCFRGVFAEVPFDAIDIYKTMRIFGKSILCRRCQPESSNFLKVFQNERYELEFITEYHAPISSLYQCWMWRKNSDVYRECQFEITADSIEYRWNDIHNYTSVYMILCNNTWLHNDLETVTVEPV